MNTLLIVDMQKGFINENNQFLVEKVNKLIKSGKFDKIIATKFVNKPNSHFEKYLNYTKCSVSPETDFIVDLPKDCTIIEKTSYGIPLDKLQELISGGGNSDIYICGTDYDCCVLANSFQLFDQAIQPKVIFDAVGTSSSHPIEKDVVKKIFTRNMGLSSVIEENIDQLLLKLY